jgi:hypothetical protein
MSWFFIFVVISSEVLLGGCSHVVGENINGSGGCLISSGNSTRVFSVSSGQEDLVIWFGIVNASGTFPDCMEIFCKWRIGQLFCYRVAGEGCR